MIWLVGLAFAALGVLFIAKSRMDLSKCRPELDRHGVPVPALISEREVSRPDGFDGDGPPWFRYTVEFEDMDGGYHRFETGWLDIEMEPGMECEISYNPDDPEDFVFMDALPGWASARVWMVSGACLAAFGILLAVLLYGA